ncbi:MAG TPA: AbrB/MazE/SpoVT family DNA-binding domain-containing protein [Chloroflexia bacterium]|nr:AbrB/MazE/SpoVT family DNA-binding domain-containing protein [Chloroflexia bacterium]
MSVVTKARIIRIGNSRVIRSPKRMLERMGFGEEVELEAREGQLIIRAARHPRYGWAEQFRAMVERGDDKLIGDDAPDLTNWDAKEWEW